MYFYFCLILVLTYCCVLRPAYCDSSASEPSLTSLGEEYFQIAFTADPSWSTAVGIHDFDNQLNTYSPHEVESQESGLRNLRQTLNRIDCSRFKPSEHIEFALLLSDVNAKLLELDQIQSWRHNPDFYSSYACRSIVPLISRDFAAPDSRLKPVIAREKLIPVLLTNARTNLSSTPKVFTEAALKQLPGIISFFKQDVPLAFQSVSDKSLKDAFAVSNAEVLRALDEYQSFTSANLLPKSVSEFALGRENFQAKLLYEEMVDTPLENRLTQGYSELHRLQKEFKDTAHGINPDIGAHEVLFQINAEYPSPDQLLPAVQNAMTEAHANSQSFEDLPSSAKLVVRETPPYLRATSGSSMDAPGQYETVDKTAYFQITLPEKDWTKQQLEQYLRGNSYKSLINNAAHENQHLVEAAWAQTLSSKIRKLIFCLSNSEGWAHYWEELMVEQQPGASDPQLKMVQINDALRRACRFVVAIRMQTQGMTVDEAKNFFIKEGLQDPPVAQREALRGATDPLYLDYTLGKLQVLQLRDEFAKLQGKNFSLKEFHNAFLAQGGAPISLIREDVLKAARANTGAKSH